MDDILYEYIFRSPRESKIIDNDINHDSVGISWNNGDDGPWAFGCDFNGNDLKNERSRGEECSGKCKQTSGCTHYTWTNFNDGTCWMKQGSISQSNAIKGPDDSVCGVLNGNSGGISWNNGDDGPWASGCDFNGNDLKNERSRGEECSGKCRQTSGCTHYTWTNFNDGTCWMKQGSISQSNANKAADDFVCGILRFIPPTSPPPGSGSLFHFI